MSVSNTTVRQLFEGDGANKNFAIPFQFIPGETNVITVYELDENGIRTLKTETTHYTLYPAGNEPTEVRFLVAPADEQVILLERTLPLEQIVDYINTGLFLAEDHEKALDRLVMLVQQLALSTENSIQANIFDEFTDMQLPPLSAATSDPSTSRVIAAKADKSGFEYGPTTQEIFDAAEAADASATLAALEAATAAAEAAAAAADAAATNANAINAAASAAAALVSENNAETAETNAETALAATIVARDAALAAETNAETAETNAETAETNAETALAAAIVARDAALAAQTAAELAETNAETAETNAETAETNAETAETNAETALAAAIVARDAALAAQAAAEAAAGAASTTVVGTRAAPTNVVGANGILFTSITFHTVNFVQGNAGAVVLSAAARIQAGSTPGQRLTLIGRSDVNTITMADGNGVDTAGLTYLLKAGSILALVWDGTVWTVETSNGV